MIQRISFVLVLALMIAPVAFGQAYLVPEGDCGTITLHATRGAEFPNLGQTIAADSVENAYLFAVPKKRDVATLGPGPRSLDFKVDVADDRVVMASIDFKPLVSGNETRTEHAKALLFCGPSAPAFDWQRSTGLGLEIYPQGWNGPRPKIKAGDSMRFIVVDRATNTLLRELPMELRREGAGRVVKGTLDPMGGMDFPYDKPGRYLVTATYRRPDPGQPEHWLVDTSTLMFQMK